MSQEKIKLKEFDTVLIAGHVTVPFSTSWSEDHKLALIVDEGVHVFELHPTPLSDQLTITFLRSWIPSSTILPFQNVIVNNKTNSYVWNQKRQDLYEMALDSTLCSLIEKSTVTSCIIQCCFSPLIFSESYLTCLTNNGVLQIYKWDLKKWKVILNVTDLWIWYCKTNDSDNIEYNLLKEKIFQLKIVTMIWVENPRLFFITAHDDGGICIWNVILEDKSFTMDVCQYFHVAGKPSFIHFCQTGYKLYYILFIGTMAGNVIGIPFKFSPETGLQKGESELELWTHKDFMKVSFIRCDTVGCDNYVFTVKGHMLIVQKVKMFKEDLLEVVETQWHEFSSPIVSFNDYQNFYIIGTRNHELLTLKLTEGGQELEHIEVPLKPKHNACFHCYGFVMSKNKAIWIAVSSAKINYDNKTVRDPTNLLIFTPHLKTYKSLVDTSYTGLIDKITENYQTTRLTEISDILEMKKCELLADPINFTENPTLDFKTSPLELKLMVWEAKLRIFTHAAEVQNIVSQCEYILAFQWCSSKRIQYTETCTQLTDLQQRSLELMEIFLRENKSSTGKGSECAICGEYTQMDNVKQISCPNSHVFPRCGLSLLPCDSVPYAFCRLCDSTVHLQFISENDYYCLFCDGLLVPDTRVTERP